MRERIATAVWSEDLESEAYVTDVDVIAGIGAAQITHKHQSLGFLLHRIKAGQEKYMREALRLIALRARQARKEKKWTLSHTQAQSVALIALYAFLKPNCDNCTGIGAIGGYDQTVAVICQECKGSGKKIGTLAFDRYSAQLLGMEFDSYVRRQLNERIRDFIDILSRMEGAAAKSVRHQVR